jgi:hypothetical protein
MNIERQMLHALVAVIVTALLSNGTTAAQSLGYPKGKPYYGSSNQRTSRSVQHARSYSRGIYEYSRDADKIDPAVAKSESEELGHNITKSQQDLATARQEAGNDAKTLATLKTVEQHLTTAAEHHKMLHEECCKDDVEGSVCMEHCNKILLELDKAQAEQDALIRSLEIKAKSTGVSSTTHPLQ